ncbi:hypothetical protein ACFX13_042557 [Malus domestica]
MDTKLCFEAIDRSLRHMRRPSIAYCDCVARERNREDIAIHSPGGPPDDPYILSSLSNSLSRRSQLQCRRSAPFFVNKVGLLNNPRNSEFEDGLRNHLNGAQQTDFVAFDQNKVSVTSSTKQYKAGESLCPKKLKVVEVVKFRDVIKDIDIDVEFTYSVNWKATSTQFQNRMDKYSKASLMPVRQKIHWLSFIIIIIVLLMGLLALLIVRRLKNEMKKFSNSDEEEDKEVGWKYIHGDVFRYPPNMSLFCAVLGVGTQLLAMLFILFLLAFFGVLYLNLGKRPRVQEGQVGQVVKDAGAIGLILAFTAANAERMSVLTLQTTVADVGSAVSNYHTIVSQSRGAYVKVEPQTFNFTRANEKLSHKITLP